MPNFTVRAAAVISGSVIALTGVLAAPAATAAPVANSAPSVSVTAAPTALPAYTTKQNKFVKYVRAQEPGLRLLSKRDTVDLGKTTCEALKAGVDTYDVIYAYTSSGFDDDETVALISGAVIYLCPGQSYKFES